MILGRNGAAAGGRPPGRLAPGPAALDSPTGRWEHPCTSAGALRAGSKEGDMASGICWKLVVAAAAALALTTGSAWAAQSVGPNQVFTGVVNGSTSDATVTVVCPGPVGPASRGRPFNDS